MTFLEKLMQEIKAMTPPADKHIADGPIPADHDLLGEVPMEARQIYCLLETIEAQMEPLKKEHDEVCGQRRHAARHDQIIDALENLRRKHSLLHDLMWAGIRDSFPESATKGILHIRDNWQLTASVGEADEDHVGLSGVMMQIFGHGR